jgi:hypothetical protein
MKPVQAIAVLCSLSLALPCVADTFKLKDGTSLQAVILKETGDSYLLEVQVTKSIKDERTVAKADVLKIERDQPDLKIFEELSKVVPVPDLFTADEYTQTIARVNKFLKDYPKSSKLKEAQAILETLKAEAAQISEGAIKLDGKIVSAADYKANAYEIDAKVQEAKIRARLSRQDVVGALRLYAEFDRDFRSTLQYGALSAGMLKVITTYAAEVDQMRSTLDARLKERANNLDRMAAEDRRLTEQAIAEEDEAIDARYKAEKDARIQWVSISPLHKGSLDDTSRFAQSEIKRLSDVKTVLGVDGGKAYREAWSAVHNEADGSTTSAALSAARSANVPKRYLAPLEEAAKGRK